MIYGQKKSPLFLLKGWGSFILSSLFIILYGYEAYAIKEAPSLESSSTPASYPTIEGEGCNLIKEEILTFAKDAFLSPIPSWWDFSKFQAAGNAPYRVLLVPNKGAYSPDTTQIKVYTGGAGSGQNASGQMPTAYWAIDPTRGQNTPTFMIVQEPGGWRGDFYSIQWGVPGLQTKEPAAQSLMDQALKLPLLLKITDKNFLIAIDTGYQFDVVSSWKVYVPGEGTPLTCAVHFHPKIDNAWDLVPQTSDLYEFGKLINDIIGVPSQDEGTLQVTAGAHTDFNKMYTLALVRPWAVVTTDEPYNTRQEVDKGLKQWSQQNPTYMTQYQKLQTLYPQAQSALTAYYETKFQYDPETAQQLAKVNLDKAFREGFVFSKGTD